jgi:conjugative transfer pilus assembly protein TraH
MLSGKAMAKRNVAGGGACYRDSTRGVRDIVKTNLTAVAGAMMARTALTSAEIDFIQNSPVPIYSILRKAVAQDNVDMTIEMMTDVVAAAYTFRVFDDLYRNADYLFRKVETISAPAGAGAAGGDCNVQLYAPAIAKFEKMHSGLWNFRLEARKSYLSGIHEHMMFMDYATKHQDEEHQVSRKQALDVQPN